MIEVLNFIESAFPNEWLSNLSNKFDAFDEAGVDIYHPLNNDYFISIIVLPERIGVALLKKNESDILLDLGGFDYSFEVWEKNILHNSLVLFKETGAFRR